jgi:hypothetical protein
MDLEGDRKACTYGLLSRSCQKVLDSAVMTTRAESRISHGLLVVVSWITDQSTDVVLALIVLEYHMYS